MAGTIRGSLSVLSFVVVTLATPGCKDSASVVTVALVEISVPAGPIRVGATAQFAATPRDANGQTIVNRPVTWSTSNQAVATINAGGLLTALQGGSVSVMATVDGKTGSVSITIVVPQPVITQLSPNVATVGSAGLTLVVNGSDFVQGAVVRWNGQDRTTTFNSDTRLSAQITAADLANPGVHNVVVRNPPPAGESPLAVFQVTIQAIGPFAASRDSHSCAVTQAGNALCWGRNHRGQLGNNSTTDRTVPTEVSGSGRYVAVGVGEYFSCALTEFGGARCWGDNAFGQLGDGTSAARSIPAPVSGTRYFTAMAVGESFACALDGQGHAWCWGVNNEGQIGDGTTTPRSTPTAVTGNLTFRTLTAGEAHVCGLTMNNELHCWGQNSEGQLGLGDLTRRVSPTRVTAVAPIEFVAAGQWHTCAITQAGSTYCWGSNGSGQVGTGQLTGTRVPSPTQVVGSFVFIAAGVFHTCGLLASGAAQCWGNNGFGQLGTGTRLLSYTPVPVQGGVNFRSLIAGFRATCGFTAAGAMHCWGSRGFGELGDGQTAIRLTPTRLSSGTFSSVQSGINFSCGLSSGSAYCWGSNSFGQLGNGTMTSAASPTPVTGLGTTNTELSLGHDHACARTTAGAVSCWGLGQGGRLGNGTEFDRTVPNAVIGGQTYRSISAGGSHTCGVTTAGQVQCWGNNDDGQLGTGDLNNRNVPTAVIGVGGITFADVTTGQDHSCARSVANALYCWGSNLFGQIGDGTTTNRSQPVLINVGTAIANVSSFTNATCARATSGAVYCWGVNINGGLGTGTTNLTQLTPRAVTGGLVFASLNVGRNVICGVTTAGAAYCWGNNPNGELGAGAVDDIRASPTAISGFGGSTTYTLVDPGGSHSCAVNSVGEAACWGFDLDGNLGLGVSGSVLTPAMVPGITIMIR